MEEKIATANGNTLLLWVDRLLAAQSLEEVCINLPNIKYLPEEKKDAYADAVTGLVKLEGKEHQFFKYVDFVDIYTGLNSNELNLFQQKHPRESALIEKCAQRYQGLGLIQGIEEGLKQGTEQGVLQGEAAMLSRMMASKFGTLSDALNDRITNADTDMLLIWCDRLLAAACAEDVCH